MNMITILLVAAAEIYLVCSVIAVVKGKGQRLHRIYGGNISNDRISQMSRILLHIRKERGISVEELAERTGMEYRQVTVLTGMLETDGVITTDLLQRCFINFG